MSEKEEKKELSTKHLLFVFAYIAHNCNATKAYQEVYGCDYDTANANGSKLLVNASIKERIDEEIGIILKDSQQLALQVVNEYKKIAFSDMGDFVDPSTGKKTCTSETDTAAISGYKEKIGFKSDGSSVVLPEYKLHDKVRALDSLSKYVVGFSEKRDVDLKGVKIIYMDKQDENL